MDTVIDNPVDAAYQNFIADPTDETALAWLRTELKYQFIPAAGVPESGPLEDPVYDSIVDRADTLMKSRKGP